MPRTSLDIDHGHALSRRSMVVLRTISARLGLDQPARYRRRVGIAVNVSLAVLFAVLLYQNQGTLPLLTQVVTPTIVGACFLFYLVSFLLQFVVWSGLMKYRHTDIGFALEAYIQTIFLGRLPGGVWKLIGRITVYRAPHHSIRAIVTINLAEIGLVLFANAVLLLFLVDVNWRLWVAGVAGILFAAFLGWRAGGSALASYKLVSWLTWIGCYMLSWVCGALMLYMIVGPFEGSIALLDSLRFWCIAGAAGILLQVLPLSSLVRDMTLVAMLQGSMPLASAVVAGFAMRLFLSMCELLTGWSLLWLLGLFAHRDRGPSAPFPK